jgi:5-methylcytosine-specific restriction protein B
VKGAISTQYSTLNDKATGMIQQGDVWQFFIPHNVYLIGTMNTIDRSVESFDLALRRRFRWERVNPDIALVRFALQSTPWKELADNLEALNREICRAELLGEDYQIGHAYLMNLQYSRNLTIYGVRNRIWADRILPLLEEYLRGSGKFDELRPAFEKAFGIK